MLTLFACPKPFRDAHIRIIQSNAIRSWLQLIPRPQVILVGDEAGTAEFASEHHLLHIPDVARSEFGTPILHDIFSKAETAASAGLLAYVNADIILLQDFMDAITNVSGGRFLMVGRRWDVDITEPLCFEYPDWAIRLQHVLHSQATLHAHTGTDYFVFPKGLFHDMPRLALGRTAFDNWLIWRARKSQALVIDATEAVTCVHQNHGYSYSLVDQASRERNDNYANGWESKRNRWLAGGRQRLFTLRDSTHRLTRGGLVEIPAIYRCFSGLLRRIPRRSDATELIARIATELRR